MNILYVASGIPVPGTLGGSTHTLEVARGLSERGHTLHVVACSGAGWGGLAALARPISSRLGGVHVHHINVPKAASLLAAPLILRLARAIHPDLIMERYYNLAGGGILAARRLGLPSILEVNALIVDPPAAWDCAEAAVAGLRDWPFASEHALMYFPRVLAFDKLRGRFESFAPGAAERLAAPAGRRI
ncbi:MAG TPA: glycosyltransferase, partial [Kouleothrix sp.]|nr:glycosyltransferase [Kouleothrix sp.]